MTPYQATYRQGTLLGALRGPLMLITLGVLLAADQADVVTFGLTWPILLILYGLLRLLERGLGNREPSEGPGDSATTGF